MPEPRSRKVDRAASGLIWAMAFPLLAGRPSAAAMAGVPAGDRGVLPRAPGQWVSRRATSR